MLAILPCHLSLITIHISDCCQFSHVHISQGSAATYLRFGGIFKCEFVAKLPLSLSVKGLWKSVSIWGSYGQEFSVLFFYWLTVCVYSIVHYLNTCIRLYRHSQFSITLLININYWSVSKTAETNASRTWGAGVVICLDRGADLHMAQLMPLPLTVSCFSKIQIGFTFLVPAHRGWSRTKGR